MRVAVVEDEDFIREGIQSLLKMLGGEYQLVGGAENGKTGLELIQREKPDIVITDIRMPDMDGLEMLRRIRESGLQVKTIVLSAYSEFEYARQAMKLGVMEYLLKPISIEEFSRALNALKIQIEKEKQAQTETLGTLEQVLRAVLYGQLQTEKKIEEYLNSHYRFNAKEPLIEICVYLGKGYKAKLHQAEKEWTSLLKMKSDLKFCIVHGDYEQTMLIVIYQFGKEKELERRIQCWMLQNSKSPNFGESIGWIKAENLSRLRERFETLHQYMDWGLSLGSDVLIAYPKVQQIQTAVCTYPIKLENQLKAELSTGNLPGAERTIEQFHAYFSNKRIYAPKDIKECYARLAWMIINVSKEINLLAYDNLNQQGLLDRIMGAKVFKELKNTVDTLMEEILSETGEEEIAHLTVKRTKSMIHEFYQTGITLDGMAAKLNITPEYLSRQFHKEVGETYSNYLKNYRINKAKELLLGTFMKQYEVAEAVGYTDAKYFSKVFKECTGYTPAEYRKANR